MTLDYPIVIIHKNIREYFKICIEQAHFSSPKSRIIVLGNTPSLAQEFDYIEYYNIDEYFNLAKDFEKHYKHFSCNDYEYELFCIQRWFILYEFMSRNNIEHVLHIDSDVLLYTDFSKEEEYIKLVQQHDYTFFDIVGSMHTSFINSKEIIKKFLDFTIELYHNPEFLTKASELNTSGKSFSIQNISSATINFPPVSDMTLWLLFSHSKGVKALDTLNPINDTLINLNIEDLNPLYTHFAIEDKELLFVFFDEKNTPWTIDKKSKKFLKMYTLHFQGSNKKGLMKKYSTYNLKEQLQCIAHSPKDFEKHKKKIKLWVKIICAFIPFKKTRDKIKRKF